jgi:hypothetical protein
LSFLVQMEVRIPHGADPDHIAKLKAEKKAHAHELQYGGVVAGTYGGSPGATSPTACSTSTRATGYTSCWPGCRGVVHGHEGDAAGHPSFGDWGH